MPLNQTEEYDPVENLNQFYDTLEENLIEKRGKEGAAQFLNKDKFYALFIAKILVYRISKSSWSPSEQSKDLEIILSSKRASQSDKLKKISEYTRSPENHTRNMFQSIVTAEKSTIEFYKLIGEMGFFVLSKSPYASNAPEENNFTI